MQRTANLAGYQKKCSALHFSRKKIISLQHNSFFCLRLNAQNIRLFWQNGYE